MNEFLDKYPLAAHQVRSASEVCQFLWERAWAERNGGNLSIRLTGLVEPALPPDAVFVKDERIATSKAEGIYYVTSTGCRLRDVAHSPEMNAAILLLDNDAGGYWILAGGTSSGFRPITDSASLSCKAEGFRPTSEFISHLMIHAMRSETSSSHRALVHSHPIELLSLTHNPKFVADPVMLNRTLWGMLPEVRLFMPKGIKLVRYLLPGSEALARATIEALREADVALWEKHGALATGEDAHDAFDFVDVANKGATVLLKCLSAGFEPEGLSDAELKELEEEFL